MVPLDVGEQFAQFTDHHGVDQIDRWVVEGDSPQRRCRAVQSETRVCHEGSALRGVLVHALLLCRTKDCSRRALAGSRASNSSVVRMACAKRGPLTSAPRACLRSEGSGRILDERDVVAKLHAEASDALDADVRYEADEDDLLDPTLREL